MFKNKLTFKYIVIVTFAAVICTGVAKKCKTNDDAHMQQTNTHFLNNKLHMNEIRKQGQTQKQTDYQTKIRGIYGSFHTL